MEYNILMTELYGNKYLQNKYTENEEQILNSKRWLAGIVDTYLNPKKEKLSMCDAGANKGYLMKAFRELGYDSYGFDKSFDIVTCTNVFEQIPINFIDTMAAELTGELKQELSLNGEHYQYTGVPRNKWNSVPGIIFMEKFKNSL